MELVAKAAWHIDVGDQYLDALVPKFLSFPKILSRRGIRVAGRIIA
jgi:hypothetical protein